MDSALSTQHSSLNPGLSPDAMRLRDLLRRFAFSPATARTDRSIASDLSIPERVVVEVADELLQAGWLVVARCKSPPGRWILLDDDTDPAHIQEARDYAKQLDDRAIGIHVRAKHARDALAAREARRGTQFARQGRLF